MQIRGLSPIRKSMSFHDHCTVLILMGTIILTGKKVSHIEENDNLLTECCEMLQQGQNSQPNYAG